MTVRNISKSLAGMEDIAQGKGTVSQTRGGSAVSVTLMDVPMALDTTVEMSALDVTKYTRARVYSDTVSYTDYIYDAADGTGIVSDTGPGTWLLANADKLSIADLSLPYVFDTVADMVASTIVFPVGKRLKTKVHNSTSNKGGATYTVATGISPNTGSPSLTAGFYASLNNGNTVNVMQWGAYGDGVNDDYAAIQAAEDFAKPLKRKVWFPSPSVEYKITQPLVGGTFTNWEGENDLCFIVKYGNTTTGLPTRVAPERPTVNDVLDVDAVLAIDHADGAWAVYVSLKNLYFRSAASNGTRVKYGVYNPRTFFYNTERVTCHGTEYGKFSWAIFQSTWLRPYMVDCSIAGYKTANDGTGQGCGTSLVMTRPYAQDCARGYDIYGMVYSHIDTPSCDRASGIGYFLSSCNGLTITSLGMEAQTSGTNGILISGSRIDINGLDDRDTSPSSSKLELNSGSRVSINSGRFTDFTTPGSAYRMVITGGSHLVTTNTSFPSNGNSFVSYGGGSSRVDTNDGIVKITDSSGNLSFDASYKYSSITNGITAYAGGGQANAIELIKEVNEVSTVATTADSVKLPVPEAGKSQKVTVINTGSNALDIYPNSGASHGSGTNLPTSLPPGSNITFISWSTIRWVVQA